MDSNAPKSFDWELTSGEAKLMSDSARIIVAHDGNKDCLSLLLTSELVTLVNRIGALVRKQKQICDAAIQANSEVLNTECEIRQLEKDLDSTRTRSQSRPIEQRLEIARARLTASRKSHSELEGQCRILERDLTSERENLEVMLETAFERVNLVRKPNNPLPSLRGESKEQAGSSTNTVNKPELSSEEGTSPQRKTTDGPHPRSEPDPEPPSMSPQALSSQAQEVEDMQWNLEHWLNAYNNAEYVFENRKNVEQENIELRKYHISIGLPRESRTEFDLRHVEREIELTRHLITVTQGLERIKNLARPYGVFTPSERFERGINEWEAPGYYTEPSEGSPEDEMPEADHEMNARIERWQQGTGSAGFALDSEIRMDVDLDEWDAETVRISESGSMIDDTSRRAKIDQWREMCGLYDGH